MKSERLTVDGEDFDVMTGAAPGQYHYNWVSGRNEGYGFSSAVSGGWSLTTEQHIHAIREFLGAVDPTTGYIADDDEEDPND